MSSFAVPFFGNITSLTVDPATNHLWVSTTHPNGRSIHPVRIDVASLLKTKQVNNNVHTVSVDGKVTSVFGHHTGMYLTTESGLVLREADSTLSECINVGPDFDLQAIVGFRDGGVEYPKSNPSVEAGLALSGSSNRKLLLVGRSTAKVVEVSDSGAFVEVATLDPTNGFGGEITSWDAETVFSPDGDTHHCAFGLDTGIVSIYYTKDDSNTFQQLTLMSEAEVPFANDQGLHERPLTSMLYVREIDRYGTIKRYLVTTSADMEVFQISLSEGIAIPRKNTHSKQIRAFVPGAMLDGDGTYRSPKFGRFYTLSQDGTVKAWLNEYINEPQSSYKAEMEMETGCIMMLALEHRSGVYSKAEFLGQSISTPHLVIAGGESIRFIPLVSVDKGDTLTDDLRDNGKMKGVPTLDLTGGRQYVLKMALNQEDADIRAASFERFKSWDAQWLMDDLVDFSKNDDLSFEQQKEVVQALVQSVHPRRIVVLESLLNRWNNTENIQLVAYQALKEVFSDGLRAHELVMNNSSDNLKQTVINDLADLARSRDPRRREALQTLQGHINHSNFDLAMLVYNHLSGEGFDAVMPGVEGVLYGIFSNRVDLRREMMVRLANRQLVDAFETTLVLRRLLEHSNETIRERALDVSLLRAPNVALILRAGDRFLHERLYVLENGSFASTDDKEAVLHSALPSDDRVKLVKDLFLAESDDIQADLDVLVELSTCSEDDVSVYALQTKACLGFESAVQGLLKLSESSNNTVQRQAVVGLGYFVSKDDPFQRLCTITLSKYTDHQIGNIAIFHAVRGYDERNQDPVQNLLRKVLDSGNGELRKTAVTITQTRVMNRMQKITEAQKVLNSATDSEREQMDDIQDQIESLESQIATAQTALRQAKDRKDQWSIEAQTTRIQQLKRDIRKIKKSSGDTTVDVSDDIDDLRIERDLLKVALVEETLDFKVRKEVYKTFMQYNLENFHDQQNRTATLKLLLNLRDGSLFEESLKDLAAYLDAPTSRDWSLVLFKQLVDQDIVPQHHSNIWHIWATVADYSTGKDYEEPVLRIGFECSAPCRCETHRNGSYTVCTRHRIRRDAFLRVLSASGDWLAGFIREAIQGRGNSSAGRNAAVIAVSDRAKQAVSNMTDPVQFIADLLNGTSDEMAFAMELLEMYPRYYVGDVRSLIFDMRNQSVVSSSLSSIPHLMTEKIYTDLISKVQRGQRHYYYTTVERYAMENGHAQELANMLIALDDERLNRKGFIIASRFYQDWGQEVLENALEHGTDGQVKLVFGILLKRLEADALRSNNTAGVEQFVTQFYSNSPVYRQMWVVERLELVEHSPQWVKNLFAQFCTSKAEEIRDLGFQKLHGMQTKDDWAVELMKQGIMDSNSEISELCFQGLLAFNKLLGPDQEQAYLSKTMREHEALRERVVATALQTTASWRTKFILDGLNDEDRVIRSMMCEKLKSISGLPDSFYQDLLEHQHEEIQALAREVLAARGLYRPPRGGVSGDLKKIILEAPPKRPYGWYGWISWYWKVQAWKDRKIDAIIAAGKTHQEDYFAVFKTLLGNFGYRAKITELWAHAMYATSWGYDDWHEFIILHGGWVLRKNGDIRYAKKEASGQNRQRLRVAWSVACTRAGEKEEFKWLINQFYDNGWRNYYKQYIKREYLFEGMFAVDSSLALGGRSEGPGYSIAQRLMNDDTSLSNDIFRLNVLRLAQQGGPVSWIGLGLTAADHQTNLESVRMRELQYSKEQMLLGLIKLLNDTDIPEQNPYELANLGGNWYDVTRLTIQLHMRTFDLSSEVDVGYWRDIASMLSCHHSQLRARAVRAYFRRFVYGEEKERFKAEIENFARQLTNTTVDSYVLLQDGSATNIKSAHDQAFDGYISLLRDLDFTQEYRKDAVGYVAALCDSEQDPGRVLPVLKSVVSFENAPLRFQAYGLMITIQSKDPSLMPLEQLIQIGLRAKDIRLKRMAISLIWGTAQLNQSEKIAKLEFILRNMNDVAAELAFELLYAVAGRPSAWDKADADKDSGDADAKSTMESTVAALNGQIDAERAKFNEFKESFNNNPNVQQSDRDALAARRQEMTDRVQVLKEQIDAANEAYTQALQANADAHTATMNAPLSGSDLQQYADAIARRDELVEMAIDGYYPELRTSAVNQGLQEVARRRPYFEQGKEEFEGYYQRLIKVVETALVSPYSDLVRHTALKMATYQMNNGHAVLIRLLNSHDSNDQRRALNALTKLGPIGLVDQLSVDGTPYERTALILLERADKDEYGTVQRYQIFNAVSRLKDRHSSVVERLFTYLAKGVDSPDFTYVLSALVDISGCRNTILRGTRWADLTPSDYSDLQPYLSHQLDWEQVNLDDFVTYYQDVYDEALLARIIDFLFVAGEYEVITNNSLIYYAKWTKGFDIQDGRQPIDTILRSLALLPVNPSTSTVQNEALMALVHRLGAQDEWIPTALEQTDGNSTVVNALVEFMAQQKGDVTYELLEVAIALVENKHGSSSPKVFDVLFKVVTQVKYAVAWRVQAMEALGEFSDPRSIVALLNAAGYDAFGEELLVDPAEDTLTDSDKNRLKIAASKGLGGMIFAQENEAIFQLLSDMSRSRDAQTKTHGYQGLRYFTRSEQYAFTVMSTFAYQLQAALNRSDRKNITFFLNLITESFEVGELESMDKHAALLIQSDTETQLKAYALASLFGQAFEMDGEAYHPLDVQTPLFEFNNANVIESAYQAIRQWVHGPHQAENINQTDGDVTEVVIDFGYLVDRSAAERTELLRAERLLFESSTRTSYTNDVAKVLASYLSDSELFDLVAYAETEGMTNDERYSIVFNALVYRSPSPVLEAVNRIQQEYRLTLDNSFPNLNYWNASIALLKANTTTVAHNVDAFAGLIGWVHSEMVGFVTERAWGDEKDREVRRTYYSVLFDLLDVAASVPSHSTIVAAIEFLMTKVDLYELLDASDIQVHKIQMLEWYLSFGQVNWEIVEGIMDYGHRASRMVLVNNLTDGLIEGMTSRILDWLLSDQAALLRLVDVLQAQTELQENLVARLGDSEQPEGALMLLSRLSNLEHFKTLIEGFRNEEGHISDEAGLTSKFLRRSTESNPRPLRVDTLMRAVSMMGTLEAEAYLSELSTDSTLEYGLRQVAHRAYQVANRKRVPLHIRRTQRQ